MLHAAQKHVKKDLLNRRIQVQEKLLLLYPPHCTEHLSPMEGVVNASCRSGSHCKR